MADNEKIHIDVQEEKLSPDFCFRFVQDAKAGAQCLFSGTVRNHSREMKVEYLEYSSYQPMAIKEIRKIAKDAMSQWKILKVAVQHRTGHLEIGDIAVIVAVSSAHRKESFEACQWMMESIKISVPIWKKERFDGGDEWVGAL